MGRFSFGEARVRALLRCLAAGAIVIGTRSAVAVDLPPIDRLAATPVPAAAAVGARAPSSFSLHRHDQLGIPTFVWGQRGGPASDRAQSARVSEQDAPEAAARAYLRALGDTYTLPAEQADAAPMLYTQSLPNGGALVKFRNRIGGVEVFREEAAVLLGASRELVAIGGYLAGGNARASFRSTEAAAAAVALADWNVDGAQLSTTGSDDDYRHLELPAAAAGAQTPQLAVPIRVKQVLFRLPDELRPAWYVEVQMHDPATGEVDGYAYVIDDDDASILFRHNLTADVAFSYRVFAETGGNNLPLPGPVGRNGFPHPTATPNGYQAPFASSNLIALQNIPFSMNDPWLPAGATVTTGNNVEAFADLVTPDNFNAGDLRAPTSAPGVFDYTHNPALAPGASATQINASTVNLFYVTNWLHDWFYDSGFNEAAGNAQTDNFGRGGLGNDSMRAQAQDFAALNNANMLTPADGGRPRMRMYVFNTMHPTTTSIASPAASLTSNGALFGPQTFNVTAQVQAAPVGNENACAALAGFAGKIALISSLNPCTLESKVRNAQAAGAVGVILYRAVDDVSPYATGMAGDTVADPTIGTTVIGISDGTAIKTLLLSQTVTATITGAFLPDRDGTLDNTIVAHEWGHYLTNRLISNAVGLTNNQGRSMGEGWGDFLGMLMLVKASDAALPNNANFNGTYANGGFVSAGPATPVTQGTYYGGRRYPASRDLTKNPLTFKHITNNVALPGAPAPQFGASGTTNSEVHNSGEVWAQSLWECYSGILNDTLGGTPRLTFAQAQDRMKSYLVMGLKLTPSTPTFVEARDALLAAMISQDAQDYVRCLQGFTKRGLGIGAVAPARFSLDHAGATENFVSGGALAVTSVTISDAAGACDNDGTIDNDENGILSITLQNIGVTTLSATTGTVTPGNPHVILPTGGTLTIPSTVPGQSVTINKAIKVANALVPETTDFVISVDDPGLSIPRPVTATRSFFVNSDQQANASATDNVETTATAWTTGTTSLNPAPALLWQRVAISGIDHRWAGPDAGEPQLTWLQSPPLNVAAAGAFSFTFKHRHSFEFDVSGNYDGGQIQISTNGGANWTSIGGSAIPTYNGTLLVYSGNVNPYTGQPAYVKRNLAYPALEMVTVNLGVAYAGQTVLVRFVVANDNFGSADGWEIDDIAFTNITNLPFPQRVTHSLACLKVTVQSGSQQWTAPSSAFASQLKALVKSGAGTPLTGVSVTFTAPGAGASATFGGSATVLTDGAGVATAPAVSANGTVGSYNVTATAGSKSALFALTNAATAPKLDVDANNGYGALTDGLLLSRYLAGATGAGLGAGATGGSPGRNTTQMAQYLTDIRSMLDIDGDGTYDPATDGLLVIRYMMGLRGNALIANALGANATRTTAGAVEAWIFGLLP